MLPEVFILITLHSIVFCNDQTVKNVKPYLFPVPFELPNRNERSEQCWLRIEDTDIVETLAIYCYIAEAFLSNFIYDYNTKKMAEDGVDVSLWIEKPRSSEEDIIPPYVNNNNSFKDWRVNTVLDPVTRRRLYITKNADCKLIMYNRDGTTNYHVDCERIIYYVNVHTSGSSVFSYNQNFILILASIFLVYLIKQ